MRGYSTNITYSGDIHSIDDIAELLDGADLLLVETGHHKPEAICAYLAERRIAFGRLVFVHHGRAILNDPVGELRKARALLGERVIIATDGMQFALDPPVRCMTASAG